MKELLEYIVKSLVSNPDAVVIDQSGNEGEVNLLLTVDPVDMGLIIGKNGQTIHAIRRLLTVRAIAEQVRVNLQLSEPEGGSAVESASPASPEQEAAEEDSTEPETDEKPQEEKPTE